METLLRFGATEISVSYKNLTGCRCSADGLLHNPDLTVSLSIETDNFLPYFCKNNKFGCEEILFKIELFDHEKKCQYQVVNCAEINCKDEVCILRYLDHFKEKHQKCEHWRFGGYLTLEFDKMIPGYISVNLKNDVLRYQGEYQGSYRISDTGNFFYKFISSIYSKV